MDAPSLQPNPCMYGILTRQLHGIPWFSGNYAPYLSRPLPSNLSHGGYDSTPYSFNATSIVIQCNRPILVPKISKFKCYFRAQTAHEISETKWNEHTTEISNIYRGLSSHHGLPTLFRYWFRHTRGRELEVPLSLVSQIGSSIDHIKQGLFVRSYINASSEYRMISPIHNIWGACLYCLWCICRGK